MDVLFNCQIESSNAAFGDSDEDARSEMISILKGIIKKLSYGDGDGYGGSSRKVLDTNGNKVGTWAFGVEGGEDEEDDDDEDDADNFSDLDDLENA